MKREKLIKTNPEDELTITIECEGRPPIYVTVKPNKEGQRCVYVRVFDGGCGSIADAPQLTT